VGDNGGVEEPEQRGRLSELAERARIESERAREYAEDARDRSPAVALAFEVAERDIRHLGGLLSGAVAFRLFLWLLPFTLLLVGVLGAVTAVVGDVPADLSDALGLQGFLAELIIDGGSESGWWIALVVGFFGTAYTGIGAVRALRVGHAAAWAIRPPRIRRPLRASGLFLLVVLGLLFVSGLTTWLRESTGLIGSVLTIVGVGAVYFLVWLKVSSILPHRDVPMRALVPGAVLVAAGAQGLHLFVVLYLAESAERAASVYGSIGAAIALLLWLFILARLVVSGAMLNATLAERRAASRPAPRPSS
jgi:uncharacterized BrkB/YihY/UPF0761 family membrane protein